MPDFLDEFHLAKLRDQAIATSESPTATTSPSLTNPSETVPLLGALFPHPDGADVAWEFDVAAIYRPGAKNWDNRTLFFHWEYFEDTICKAMGGRVAEMIVFGHLNSGAANDLEQATGIARRMVREWGMSEEVGPMAWSSGGQQVFLGEDLMSSGREYSDDTAKMLERALAAGALGRRALMSALGPGFTAGFLTLERDAPHVPSPLAYDGIAYVPKGNSGVITAIDVVSGERIYGPERLPTVGNLYASPVAADGKIYFVGEGGSVVVIAAGDEFEQVSMSRLGDSSLASPAISNGTIVFRTVKGLIAVAHDKVNP